MTLKPSSPYFAEFTTSDPATGAAVNADSLPVATANHNGTDDGTFALTVANIDAGRYKVTGTVPSGYTKGAAVSVTVAATCSGVAGKAVIDRFSIDTKLVGDLNDSPYNGGAVASVTAPVTAGTVSDKAGYSLATAPPTAAAITTAVVAGMATAPVGSVAGIDGQAPPANWSAQAIDADGRVQVQYGTSAGQVSATAGVVDANTVAVNGGPVVAFDGVLQGGSATTATLASSSSTATDFYKGRAILFINTDQSAFIAAYNGSTKVATLDRTLAVALASGEEYSMSLPQAVGSVDAIQIEQGVNMRQALAPILAASAGLVSGVGTGPILIKGAGTSTTRITATTDAAGNRTAITLTLPN